MSERKFNVGDRVRVIGCYFERTKWQVGSVTTITGFVPSSSFGELVEVALPRTIPDGRVLALYLPHHLEPVYDGNEKVSWSECAWQPKKVGA